jgi:hypothetical protein
MLTQNGTPVDEPGAVLVLVKLGWKELIDEFSPESIGAERVAMEVPA